MKRLRTQPHCNIATFIEADLGCCYSARTIKTLSEPTDTLARLSAETQKISLPPILSHRSSFWEEISQYTAPARSCRQVVKSFEAIYQSLRGGNLNIHKPC